MQQKNIIKMLFCHQRTLKSRYLYRYTTTFICTEGIYVTIGKHNKMPTKNKNK